MWRWRWRGAGLAGVLLLGCFVALGVVAHGGPWGPDRSLTALVTGWRSPALTSVVRVANAVFAPVLAWAAAGLVAAAGVVAAWRRHWPQVRLAAGALVVYLAGWRAVAAVKLMVNRPRPPASAALDHAAGSSYPSGHVAAVAAVGALAVAVALWRGRRLAPVLVAAVAAPLVTGFDRVYLGVHYPTDVVGSLCGVWGLGLVVAAAYGWRRFSRSDPPRP